MKFLRMVFINCKKYFKDYKNLIFMFIIPIACIAFVNIFDGGSSSSGLNLKVAFVNLDKGSLGDSLITDVKVNSVYYGGKNSAINELKSYNLIALYEIPENFTEEINKGEKPVINAYKLEKGNNTTIFESQIEEKVNQLLKVQTLKNNNIISSEKELDKNIIKVEYHKKPGMMSSDGFMPIVLLMYFLIGFSANISTDFLKLRKEKILERFLATNNKGYEIMGSIYLSMLISQLLMYTAAFLVMNVVFKYHFQNFGILILNVALMSMVSISLGVMVSRFFKDEKPAAAVIMLISLFMFFIYIAGMEAGTSSDIPKIILTVNKFTPLYWALDSIDKSVLFPNVFVLILIALVFFTAGSIKFSSFAKNE
ncbi:MAG: ABC transporter permease [Bacillota bacterium]|nr:ABC transporter permease [Bacillota bacterium]